MAVLDGGMTPKQAVDALAAGELVPELAPYAMTRQTADGCARAMAKQRVYAAIDGQPSGDSLAPLRLSARGLYNTVDRALSDIRNKRELTADDMLKATRGAKAMKTLASLIRYLEACPKPGDEPAGEEDTGGLEDAGAAVDIAALLEDPQRSGMALDATD